MARSVRIIGDKELYARLDDLTKMDAIKKIVQRNGSELQRGMMRQTGVSFKKGYVTGQTKRSIQLNITNSGFTAEVEPTTEYSPYVEYGTRFMEAEPFVRPSFNAQSVRFKSDLDKLMR